MKKKKKPAPLSARSILKNKEVYSKFRRGARDQLGREIVRVFFSELWYIMIEVCGGWIPQKTRGEKGVEVGVVMVISL